MACHCNEDGYFDCDELKVRIATLKVENVEVCGERDRLLIKWQEVERDLTDALRLGSEAIEAMEWAYPDNHVYCDRKCIDTKHALIKAWHGRFDTTLKE